MSLLSTVHNVLRSLSSSKNNSLPDYFQFLQSSTQADTPKPFVEKFKYNVISSSLLSPALPTTHSRRSSTPLSVPGKLHSRASSLDHGVPTTPATPVPPSDPSYAMISLLTALTVTIFSTGYLLLALITLIVTLLLVYNLSSTTDSCQSDMIVVCVLSLSCADAFLTLL